MSRFDLPEYDGDDWALQTGRWIARRNSVMKGKPGREQLKQIKEYLENLPHKRLYEGYLVCDQGFCAIGGAVYRKLIDKDGLTPKEAWKTIKKWVRESDMDYSYSQFNLTKDIGKEQLGITETLSEIVAEVNDELTYNFTPEERYNKVISWINNRLNDPIGQTSYPTFY